MKRIVVFNKMDLCNSRKTIDIIKKIEAELNRSAADGWQMVFMVIEQKRFWLFWSREAAIITLGK